MFSIYWTRDIQVEAIRVMRRNHPEWPGTAIERRLHMMEAVIDEMVIVPEGQYSFTGADEGDFHVHAAAVHGRANYLLTSNAPADFTADPDAENYEIINADDFFNLVADSNNAAFVSATVGQFEYYSRQGVYTHPIHVALSNAGCPTFGERVKGFLAEFAQRH
mgnify:FL=1